MQTTTRSRSSREEQLIIVVDRAIYRIARHWVWLLNIVGALLAGLPVLAPVLEASGHHTVASWIYRAYSLVCSQTPDHTFHLFGFRLAYCERCMSIYGGLLLLGLLYGASKRSFRPASLTEATLLSLPVAIDGVTQFFGWRQSTWEIRVATGTLFAVAIAWLVFPRLETGFREISRTVEAQFARLVTEGRATPLN